MPIHLNTVLCPNRRKLFGFIPLWQCLTPLEPYPGTDTLYCPHCLYTADLDLRIQLLEQERSRTIIQYLDSGDISTAAKSDSLGDKIEKLKKSRP